MKYITAFLFIISCAASFGQDTASAGETSPKIEVFEITDIDEAVKDSNAIFEVVDSPPSYTGGETARQKFIVANLVYPKKAIDAKIQGTVHLQFVVEKDGSVSNVKIMRDIGYGCGEEAARVIGMMKWNPGEHLGKRVRVKISMPIKYRLK